MSDGMPRIIIPLCVKTFSWAFLEKKLKMISKNPEDFFINAQMYVQYFIIFAQMKVQKIWKSYLRFPNN